jgi:hypothetical protein
VEGSAVFSTLLRSCSKVIFDRGESPNCSPLRILLLISGKRFTKQDANSVLQQGPSPRANINECLSFYHPARGLYGNNVARVSAGQD